MDVSLLAQFDIVFVLLFVWAVVFALLQKTKVITDNLNINIIIAVATSLIVIISQTLVDLLRFIIPWFAIAIIFFILLIFIFRTFGASESDISKAVGDKTLQWTLIAVGIIIIFAGFSTVFGQKLAEASQASADGTTITDGGSSSFEQNIYKIVFNPKVLGMVVIFGVAIFAVALLSGNP